jgi:hypothetical protein
MSGSDNFPELGASYFARHVSRGLVISLAKLVIAGSGAVDATNTTVEDPAFTFTLSATGVYTMTFPKAQKGDLAFGIYSPTPTIGGVVVSAIDWTAGTATIKTIVGVTPTQPASGDYIWVRFTALTEV